MPVDYANTHSWFAFRGHLIGGFDLAAERVGFTVKWQVEIDDYATRVLEKHWPDVRRYRDVRECGGGNLEPVDIICGGFPCKQTSVAAAITRRRTGLAGRDSGLWREHRRIIRELQPGIAVVENPESAWLQQVQGDLESLGRVVYRTTVTAAGVGAPHLRRRVFLVADVDSERLARYRALGPSEVTGESRPTAERNPWLQSLSGVLRVDDGVSDRLDRRARIHVCGNAVVPAAAEWIFSRIKEAYVEAQGVTPAAQAVEPSDV